MKLPDCPSTAVHEIVPTPCTLAHSLPLPFYVPPISLSVPLRNALVKDCTFLFPESCAPSPNGGGDKVAVIGRGTSLWIKDAVNIFYTEIPLPCPANPSHYHCLTGASTTLAPPLTDSGCATFVAFYRSVCYTQPKCHYFPEGRCALTHRSV